MSDGQSGTVEAADALPYCLLLPSAELRTIVGERDQRMPRSREVRKKTRRERIVFLVYSISKFKKVFQLYLEIYTIQYRTTGCKWQTCAKRTASS